MPLISIYFTSPMFIINWLCCKYLLRLRDLMETRNSEEFTGGGKSLTIDGKKVMSRANCLVFERLAFNLVKSMSL